MNADLLTLLTIFALAVFVGFEVISKVPVVLHTPLMSGTNAIHGIVVVGAILVMAHTTTPLVAVLGFIGIVFGAANLVGGLLVTDRMLALFKKKKAA
jgi:H+-translocating NAD(P) transhydrogenase subunit alpha